MHCNCFGQNDRPPDFSSQDWQEADFVQITWLKRKAFVEEPSATSQARLTFQTDEDHKHPVGGLAVSHCFCVALSSFHTSPKQAAKPGGHDHKELPIFWSYHPSWHRRELRNRNKNCPSLGNISARHLRTAGQIIPRTRFRSSMPWLRILKMNAAWIRNEKGLCWKRSFTFVNISKYIQNIVFTLNFTHFH